MVQLEKLPRDVYGEIYQSLPIKFGFVNKITEEEYKEVFVPFICRDFFTDALWSEENKKPVTIYGFKYDPSKASYDKDKTRMAVWFPNEDVVKLFFNNKKYLDKIEEDNKLEPSTYVKVDNITFIFDFDKYWQSRAYLMSLLTGLIRWLSHDKITDKEHFIDTVEKASTTDGGHFKSYKCAKSIKNMIKDLRIMDKYNYGVVGDKDCHGIKGIHNNSGIMGVFYSPETSKYGPHLRELYK
jgi:hypothetical protein